MIDKFQTGVLKVHHKSNVFWNEILNSMLFVGKECFDMQHSHEAMTYQDEVIDEHEPAEKKYFA